jgi:magnesium-dependent phosphatase 1
MSVDLPKVVVWDVDGTLWLPEMYQLPGGAPFKQTGESLQDVRGKEVSLLADAREILWTFHRRVRFAVASTSDEPAWAHECLQKFLAWEGKTLANIFDPDGIEIYGAMAKTVHFAEISAKLGVAYSEMLFLDNELRNIEAVAPLGVTCVHTPPGGVTLEIFERALANWRNRQT